jgi:RNA recognition motif-containing protein
MLKYYFNAVPSTTLWIGQLPPGTSEDSLRQTFSPFGQVDFVKVYFFILLFLLAQYFWFFFVDHFQHFVVFSRHFYYCIFSSFLSWVLDLINN